MAAIITGLGGPQDVGDGSFRASPLTAGNHDDGSVPANINLVFGPCDQARHDFLARGAALLGYYNLLLVHSEGTAAETLYK